VNSRFPTLVVVGAFTYLGWDKNQRVFVKIRMKMNVSFIFALRSIHARNRYQAYLSNRETEGDGSQT